MHYVVKEPAGAVAPNGDRIERAVILLHGFPDSWRTFEEMLERMPFGGYDAPVLAIDMRGLGRSSSPDENAFTQADYAADVAAFMDALRIEKAVLVGHSMGGMIAHNVAVSYPDRVEGLVLISAVATLADGPVAAELQPVLEAFADDAPAPVEFIEAFQASTFYEPVAPSVLYRYVAESLRVEGRVLKATMAGLGAEDHRAQLAQLDIPALILWGEEDQMFARAQQDELKELLSGSQLITFPGAGHALNVERAGEVVEAIQVWLQTL
jgi:pimeloyl-ACP methyl ester carboxylesterase